MCPNLLTGKWPGTDCDPFKMISPASPDTGKVNIFVFDTALVIS